MASDGLPRNVICIRRQGNFRSYVSFAYRLITVERKRKVTIVSLTTVSSRSWLGEE